MTRFYVKNENIITEMICPRCYRELRAVKEDDAKLGRLECPNTKCGFYALTQEYGIALPANIKNG